MMKDIELIYVNGPFGDETCIYDVKTKAETVGEFINMLMAGKCYGDKYIKVVIRSEHDAAVAYITMGGGIERTAADYRQYCDVKIDKITAIGGWGAMTYDITPKEGQEMPRQTRYDFSMVYWGYDIWGEER